MYDPLYPDLQRGSPDGGHNVINVLLHAPLHLKEAKRYKIRSRSKIFFLSLFAALVVCPLQLEFESKFLVCEHHSECSNYHI